MCTILVLFRIQSYYCQQRLNMKNYQVHGFDVFAEQKIKILEIIDETENSYLQGDSKPYTAQHEEKGSFPSFHCKVMVFVKALKTRNSDCS